MTDIRLAANASAALTGTAVPFSVDNRQANHQWGPWMWAAGSYAEPLQSDEQPESWESVVPEPKADRASADHLRRMGWLYSQTQFCPPSAMPGFAHHQTDRLLRKRLLPAFGRLQPAGLRLLWRTLLPPLLHCRGRAQIRNM